MMNEISDDMEKVVKNMPPEQLAIAKSLGNSPTMRKELKDIVLKLESNRVQLTKEKINTRKEKGKWYVWAEVNEQTFELLVGGRKTQAIKDFNAYYNKEITK